MENNILTFEEVFNIWMEAEESVIEGRDLLALAQSKGFESISAWRRSIALRLEMDRKEWKLETIKSPNEVLPQILVGPYQGWSRFFDNQLHTSYAQAVAIPEFLEWCHTHDRIIPISQNFPKHTTLILYRKPDGRLIHIEGGHRICAVAYRQELGSPIDFRERSVKAAVAEIDDVEIAKLLKFLEQGTSNQPVG
jgi:hypothetical protein